MSADLRGNIISIFDRQPLTKTIVYGSIEYDDEVKRILEREAYGIRNTAFEWNRLNEATTNRNMAFEWNRLNEATINRSSVVVFYWLLSKIGVGLVWAVSIFLTLYPIWGLLQTFRFIQ